MYFLISVPIILLASIVRLISVRYKLSIFKKISTVVLVIGIVFFIFTYVQYYGIGNMVESFKKFLDMKIK